MWAQPERNQAAFCSLHPAGSGIRVEGQAWVRGLLAGIRVNVIRMEGQAWVRGASSWQWGQRGIRVEGQAWLRGASSRHRG